MFQYVIAGVAAAVFGGIALREATKPTGEKVKNGDSVFVRADSIRVASSKSAGDDLGLRAFLAGFVSTNVKIADVSGNNGNPILRGSIVGFPKALEFDRSAVVSIERNGQRIT